MLDWETVLQIGNKIYGNIMGRLIIAFLVFLIGFNPQWGDVQIHWIGRVGIELIGIYLAISVVKITPMENLSKFCKNAVYCLMVLLIVTGGLVGIRNTLVDVGEVDSKWPPSFITTEEEPITETPTPTLTPKQKAEEIVRDYYRNISEKLYDEAYSLLDDDLQEHPNFLRPKWDDYVSTTTFVIQNDMKITSNGNVYRLEFELAITPSEGTKRLGTRTFCVTNNPQDEIWIIKSINDESIRCW